MVSDSHEGLQHAISKVFPTALWQRCCVHFLRNARDKLSRSADPACLEGLKRLWGCEHVGEAREALGAWVARWGDEKGFGRLVEWVEEHVEETLTVYRLPREHRLRMKSTNMLERYNEELRRRTRVVRIFPNAEFCLRLILALAAETHERWLTGQRYLYGRVSAPTGNCRKFWTQLTEKTGIDVDRFIHGRRRDTVIEVVPRQGTLTRLRRRNPGAAFSPYRLRLVKYAVGDTVFILGTTLLDRDQYSIDQLSDLYHARWGIEELSAIPRIVSFWA